jgi:hypothetical protein
MDLFTPVVGEEAQHPYFRSIWKQANGFNCDVLNEWARGFKNRDGKFVKEFQTTFDSSFWELYLFAVIEAVPTGTGRNGHQQLAQGIRDGRYLNQLTVFSIGYARPHFPEADFWTIERAAAFFRRSQRVVSGCAVTQAKLVQGADVPLR